jgi:hypothetical protein
MTLILRTMKKHVGRGDGKDDYVVLDGGNSGGRIYKEHGEARWFWSVNTSPFPAPPPNNSPANSLEEAKHQFKQRYEQMKALGVRPFPMAKLFGHVQVRQQADLATVVGVPVPFEGRPS